MPPWLRKRPWIWLVVLYGLVVAVHTVVVWVAERNAPEAIPGAPTAR